MCRRRDPPFSALNFRSGAYNFHKLPQKSVPEHHHFTFFGGVCRSGDHHFQNFFNFNPFIASHGRLSPNAKAFGSATGSRPFRRLAFSRSKRIKLVPEIGIFTLKTAQARSGAPHFQAQNGSSSFRSSTFCPCFTLPRHIPTKILGSHYNIESIHVTLPRLARNSLIHLFIHLPTPKLSPLSKIASILASPLQSQTREQALYSPGGGGVLRFGFDGGVPLKPPNLYPSLRVILAGKGTHY